MIEHLFHNDHGEYTILLSVLGSLSVLWGIFCTRISLSWRKFRKKPTLCVDSQQCCEHHEPLATFTNDEVQVLLTVTCSLFREEETRKAIEDKWPPDLFAYGAPGTNEEARTLLKSLLKKAGRNWNLQLLGNKDD